MSAKEELIAAALRLAALAERNTDDRNEWQHAIDSVREGCARAMVQPDMVEVERLIDAFGSSCDSVKKFGHITSFKPIGQQITERREARAALLAHIQRRGVPEGWKEATIAWEVCASIHREYAKKKDPFFTTRQADFVKHTEAARAAMLAAAPAPDHFRDAAKMVAEPADDRIASAIHYPECWDTAAYPTVESALSEVFAHYRCTEHDAPGEVPMPEPTVSTYEGYRDSAGVWHPMSYSNDQMRTYGIACRAAGEAAGYARGLKEADKLLQALRDIADPIAAYERDLPPGYTLDGAACVRMADNPETYRRMAREAIADLRGEVK